MGLISSWQLQLSTAWCFYTMSFGWQLLHGCGLLSQLVYGGLM